MQQAVELNVGETKETVAFEELATRNQTKGIVFEHNWSQLTEEEIKSELKAEGYGVRDVKQMKKRDPNGAEIKTGGCIITFDNDQLPDRIKLCGVSYRIRQYFLNPLICGKCLKVGHIKAKCQ